MDSNKLRLAITKDIRKGLVPFFVLVVFGSTSSTFFDDLPEISRVIDELRLDVWIHVDGAYAGSALVCPELRPFMCGLARANSFNINTNKWFLTVADCSLLWVANR